MDLKTDSSYRPGGGISFFKLLETGRFAIFVKKTARVSNLHSTPSQCRDQGVSGVDISRTDLRSYILFLTTQHIHSFG